MIYALLCAAFLTVAVVVAVILRATGKHPDEDDRAPRAGVLAAVGVALVVLTAVFDNLMIAAGLFAYGDETTSGLRIGLAPVEDFAYPIAVVILLPALWTSRGRRRDH